MQVKIYNRRVSLDFDGTIEDEFDGSVNKQKEEIQDICKQLLKNNCNVFIITKRFGLLHPETYIVYKVANDLGVKRENVYFTDREMKDKKISELNIDVHFENSEYEVNLINKNVPNILVVHVEDPYWRDLVY